MLISSLSFSQFNPPFIGIGVALPLNPPPPPPCQNSGFEDGTFNNWETFVGSVTSNTGGINLATFTQTFDPSQHQIVNTNTTDIFGGFKKGNCGNKAAKVGDNNPGYDDHKASMIKYTFTVTPANVNFSFRYALVLDDPGAHTPNQKPFLQYMLLQGNTHIFNLTNLITSKKFVADGNNPFYTVLNNGVIYKDWSTECINLSAYMGQQVSFLFIEADCALGAHGAYAYVDCLCENNDAIANTTMDSEFCLGDQIMMDGTASINEDSYFVSITESDANWNVIPGTEKSQWFIAQQAGIINLSALANQWGFQFQCNRYYRVKLAVSNSCVPWNETTKLIYIRCPEDVGIGQDITLCCNSTFPITIEDENYSDHPTYTYNWIANPPWLINNPTTAPAFTYIPHQSATFNVTVTDDYGCALEDELDVIIEQDFEVTLSYENIGCCSELLIPSVNFINCEGIYEEDPTWLLTKYQQLHYLWSDGSTDVEHQVSPNQNTTYTVTVSNLCYSHTISITVPKTPSGNFPTLIAANSIHPYSSNPLVNKLIIREFGPNAPADGQPAYNATGYWLIIYSRWGDMVRKAKEIKFDKKCPLLQGEIVWDGTDDNGNTLPIGVYIYTLQLKNECRGVGWTNMCDFLGNAGSNATNCTKKCWQWWPPGLVCCESLPCPYDVTLYNY